MADCLFCKIVAGQIPNHTVVETADALAFLDIFPCVDGHIVVIPKTHAVTLLELPLEKVGPLFEAVQMAMKRAQAVLGCAGFSVGWNHGEAGGQAVPHLHVHILPRWEKDGGGNMHSIVKVPAKISVAEMAGKFKI